MSCLEKILFVGLRPSNVNAIGLVIAKRSTTGSSYALSYLSITLRLRKFCLAKLEQLEPAANHISSLGFMMMVLVLKICFDVVGN